MATTSDRALKLKARDDGSINQTLTHRACAGEGLIA
jgi:hypothetical protein